MVEPFLGSIQYFAFKFAPTGWSQCAGQQLAVSQYQALFSLLSNKYGGDGNTNFNLPDYRGRAIMGAGTDPVNDLTYTYGQKGGAESTTIPLTALPPHTHEMRNFAIFVNTAASTTGIPNPNTVVPAI